MHRFSLEPISRLRLLIFAAATLFSLSSCSLLPPEPTKLPELPVPENFHSFSLLSTSATSKIKEQFKSQPWWEGFFGGELDSIIKKAVKRNLDIKIARNRLEQAKANSQVGSADLFPQLSGSSSISRSRFERSTTSYDSDFRAGPQLFYEIDLWGRLAESARAAKFREIAALNQQVATCSEVITRVSTAWINYSIQRALEQLISSQIKTGTNLLRVIEGRLAYGRATVLDVSQQQQNLASLRAQLPEVMERKANLWNQIKLLLAEPDLKEPTSAGELRDLPALSTDIKPLDLLYRRPELAVVWYELLSQDASLRSQILERLPKLSLNFSYVFSTADLSRVFTDQLGSILGAIEYLAFDGGRRDGRIDFDRALYRQRVNEYTKSFLQALIDVDRSIEVDYWRRELVRLTTAELDAAKRAYEEAKSRYLSGLGDFLSVITALSNVQATERKLVTVRGLSLLNRVALYQFLGFDPPSLKICHKPRKEILLTPTRGA